MKILLFLCLLLIGAGCQKSPIKPTQQLRVNFQEGDLPSLHPHDLVIYLRGLSIAKALFEPLTRINAQGNIDLAAAESVDLSEDQLRYTFILRKNFWSDGQPVTAFHYEKAWKAALAPQSICSRSDLLYPLLNAERAKKGEVPLDCVGVKALDAQTLQVDLAFPSPYFLELTAQAITFPLADLDLKAIPLFNGPFMVEEWKKGSCLRLKPNPYYWNADQIGLQQIEISFIEDINTIYSLYEKGEIDWVGVPFCPLTPELIANERNKQQLKSHPIGRSFWIFLNTDHPALASSAIRRALSLALDRKAIAEHLLIGGIPSQKPLAFQLLSSFPTVLIEENVVKAQNELQKGFQELGIDKADFPPLEISYSQQSMRKQFAEYLQESWHKNLGLEIRLKSVEWNVLRNQLEKGLFQISMAYDGAYYNDPLELLERFASHTPSNFSQWVYLPFGTKIAEAKYEKDGERRITTLGEAEEILLDQMPIIPICTDCILFSHSPALSGYVIDPLGALDLSHCHFLL